MAKLKCPTKAELSQDQVEFIETSLRNSFRLDSISIEPGLLHIDNLDDGDSDRIKNTVQRLLFIAKSVNREVVFNNDIDCQYTDDPQPALEESRQVIPIQPGFYTFQGEFLQVFHALNRKIREIAAEFNAIEQEYPTVWPVRLFKKIDYFHEFPQQLIMCAPVKPDFESRAKFAKRYRKEEEYTTIEMDDLMAPAEYGLEPAVCDCCYYGLEGARQLADAYYTCYNKVFRNERSQSNQLDRLTNFSVRDIMYVGTETFVLEARQRLIDRLIEVLSSLKLRARIEVANDPFFANESAMKSVFQNSHCLKYELLVEIPHLEKNIAAGSVNLHLDFFGRAFDIECSDKSVAHSGCIGVGMERMVYALYCQHGSSISDWPITVLQYLGLETEK